MTDINFFWRKTVTLNSTTTRIRRYRYLSGWRLLTLQQL